MFDGLNGQSGLYFFQVFLYIYLNNNNVLFITHQDTIRSFMFYKLESDNFNMDKPSHCDLQYIEKNDLKKYINPV